MTRNITRFIVAVFLVSAMATNSLAGVAGKVAGAVTDTDSGNALVAANVALVGTPYGATTTDDGRYHILNVPAGRYELRVDYIGFKSYIVQEIRVSPDLTTRVDVALEATTLDVGETVVVAERELIQPSITNSYRITSGEEIENAPLRGYQDAVAVNAGVVSDEDGSLHFRGGRGNEVAFYVDGVLQNDLLTGSNLTDVSNGAIEEVSVQNGGFNAEYGYAMSGIVNVVTRSGGSEWSGRLEALSDGIADVANSRSFGHTIVNASVGGPLAGDKLRFFGSVESQDLADKDPSPVTVAEEDTYLTHNDRQRINATARVTYKPTDSFSLAASFVRSQRDENRYYESWKYNLEHAPRIADYTNNFSLKGTYFLGQNTFAEAQVSMFETDYQVGDGTFFDDLDAYVGNRSGEGPSLVEEDSLGNPILITNRIDETGLYYLDGAAYDDYLHRNSQNVGFRADLVHQAVDVFTSGFDHEIKTGVDVQSHTLRSYRNAFPTGGSQTIDAYGYNRDGELYDGADDFDDYLSAAKTPLLFAYYIQDKMEYEDLIVNAGLRFDYLDSQSDIFKNLSSEPQPGVPLDLSGDDQVLGADDFESNTPSTQVSPRIGVSFPVSDVTHFHLNYGSFFQQPNLNDLYSGLGWYNQLILSGGFAAQVGNPNLEAQRTTAYEVGVKHEPSEGMMVDVTVFYRDTDGLINLANQDGSPVGFIAPFNVDAGTNKGVDLTFEMLRRNKISARASYTLAFASGTGSSDNSTFNNVWLGYETAKTTKALDYDQRHTFFAALDIRNKSGEGPAMGNSRPLENAGVNFIVRGGSGLAYTPTNVHNAVDLGSVPRYEPTAGINSSYRPWSFRVDMKANKEFEAIGTQANAYVEVLNLFDRENILDVYTGTGTAEDDGYLGTNVADAQIEALGVSEADFTARYRDRLSDPAFYDIPRLVRAGLILSF